MGYLLFFQWFLAWCRSEWQMPTCVIWMRTSLSPVGLWWCAWRRFDELIDRKHSLGMYADCRLRVRACRVSVPHQHDTVLQYYVHMRTSASAVLNNIVQHTTACMAAGHARTHCQRRIRAHYAMQFPLTKRSGACIMRLSPGCAPLRFGRWQNKRFCNPRAPGL